MVILTPREQEYLLAAIEASLQVRDARSLFLWTQGPLQALLPHRIMVGLQFGASDMLVHLQCLHSAMFGSSQLRQLADAEDGLAVRLARHCRQEGFPQWLHDNDDAARRTQYAFLPDLRSQQLDNVLLHGTCRLTGDGTVFALFGMPQEPGVRQAYFLELLLPHLHLALLRVGGARGEPAREAGRQVSRREMEVLHWVREGKSNEEVGRILGISALTVKNHLQRIYKTLGVSNRTQAVARGLALRLLDAGAHA